MPKGRQPMREMPGALPSILHTLTHMAVSLSPSPALLSPSLLHTHTHRPHAPPMQAGQQQPRGRRRQGGRTAHRLHSQPGARAARAALLSSGGTAKPSAALRLRPRLLAAAARRPPAGHQPVPPPLHAPPSTCTRTQASKTDWPPPPASTWCQRRWCWSCGSTRRDAWSSSPTSWACTSSSTYCCTGQWAAASTACTAPGKKRAARTRLPAVALPYRHVPANRCPLLGSRWLLACLPGAAAPNSRGAIKWCCAADRRAPAPPAHPWHACLQATAQGLPR